MVACALRPLGFGTTQSSDPANGSGWRPSTAFGFPNAERYAVMPATATTLGVVRRTRASSSAPPATSSSFVSSSARAVARRTRLVIPMPRERRWSRSASVIPSDGEIGSVITPPRSSAG